MKYKYPVSCVGLVLAIASGLDGLYAVVQAANSNTEMQAGKSSKDVVPEQQELPSSEIVRSYGTANYQPPPNYAKTPPPDQPVPFSHALHAGKLNLPCTTCHLGAGPAGQENKRTKGGRDMTLPGTAICMDCHRTVAPDSPGIHRLVKFHSTEKAIPWNRVYRVLEGVNWSHKPHLQAGIQCQTCHGEVEQMEVMSMATAVTAMSTCLSCHRAYQAGSECETCHAWPAGDHFRQWGD